MPDVYKSIFLIDDDDINNLLNRQFLAFALPKVLVSTFQDASKISDQLMEGKLDAPDLILLDINMPEMDGWEFLERLENSNIDADVMVLSSSIHFSDLDRAKNFPRVKCYIEKPLTEDKIAHFIRDRKFSVVEVD